MVAYARPVQARPDTSSGGLHPLRPAVDDAFVAEMGRSWDGLRLGSGIVGRINGWVEDLQPTVKLLVTTSGHYQEIACAGRGNVGKPNGFRLVTEQLLLSGLDELDRRTATQWLEPKPSRRIDMPAWGIAGGRAGGVGEDYDGEFKPFCLMYGHHANALSALLDDGSVLSLTRFCILIHALDESAKGGGTALFEAPGQVDHPQAVR
jgi:hypothetical protein